MGVPYDRPMSGTAEKLSTRFACGRPLTPDYFDFQQFSSGDFVGAMAETLTAETVTRVLYLTTRLRKAKALRSCSNIFSWPARWLTPSGDSAPRATNGPHFPEKVAIQLNDTHPTLAVPELMRILLDEAKLGGTRHGT